MTVGGTAAGSVSGVSLNHGASRTARNGAREPSGAILALEGLAAVERRHEPLQVGEVGAGQARGDAGPVDAKELVAVQRASTADRRDNEPHVERARGGAHRELVALMTATPSDGADMKTWAKRIGVADRTLNRLLVAETGLSFGRWRQQLHIILAIQSMSRGTSIQNVSSDLGHATPSSFVTMFRKALGTSPARYMALRGAKRSPL